MMRISFYHADMVSHKRCKVQPREIVLSEEKKDDREKRFWYRLRIEEVVGMKFCLTLRLRWNFL